MAGSTKKTKLISFLDRNLLWISSILLVFLSFISYLTYHFFQSSNAVENVGIGIMCGLVLPFFWWILYELIKKPAFKVIYLPPIIVPFSFLLLLIITGDYFYLSIALAINALIHLILYFTGNQILFNISINYITGYIFIKNFRRLYKLHLDDISQQKSINNQLTTRYENFTESVKKKIKSKEDALKDTDVKLKKALTNAFNEAPYLAVVKQLESQGITPKQDASNTFYKEAFNALKANNPTVTTDLLSDTENFINDRTTLKGNNSLQLNSIKKIQAYNVLFSRLLEISRKSLDTIQKEKDNLLDSQIRIWKLIRLKKDKTDPTDKEYFNLELSNLKSKIESNNLLQSEIKNQFDSIEKLLATLERNVDSYANETIEAFFLNLKQIAEK